MLLIRWPKVSPVHPRLRGELFIGSDFIVNVTGSSPLARGTQEFLHQILLLLRFIPACAGNSFIVEIDQRLSPVHPRLRGELCP